MMAQLSLSEISHVIALAMAPAFLLVATAAFSSLVVGKMSSIVTRLRALNAIGDHEQPRAHLRADIPRLKRCAKLIGRSLACLVASGFVTTCLMIVAFLGALVIGQREIAVAILFVVALTLFAAAFAFLLYETMLWHHESDHQA